MNCHILIGWTQIGTIYFDKRFGFAPRKMVTTESKIQMGSRINNGIQVRFVQKFILLYFYLTIYIYF